MVRLLGGLAITVMTLYCSPRGAPARDEAAREVGSTRNWRLIGSAKGAAPTCKPKWVVWSVCCRSNRHARSWLARAWNLDEKAVRRIAGELGAQMLATRTRDLMRFRRGELPAGNEFAGKSVAVGIDGGRVRVRTVVENDSRQRQDGSGRSSGSSGASPRLSSCSRWIRRGGWFREAARSSTARSKAPMR